ncbi:proline racemase family protein [Nonomuraea spiralis]|uniref:Proline racemase family protein n=1 Tax=Nonomuraea spiralis TaxID=46182 RepID=A0ABV5IPI3_9ACTN|nr:proline racemase family protein [Nonomuraea spiralis]GGT27656.1 trans-3-hydroxy-L-proline dehydratase [Nonomuraea spiralis]
MISTVDYHTGGEPFRIVTGGVPEIPGRDVLTRRENAPGHADHVRRLLCHEPRGHADMYGCFLVPPDDAGAHLGVLFWHKDGFSTACGHGTIALGAYAVHEGLVEADPDGETDVVVDVPSGRVTARVRCSGGRVEAVTFVSVPSYVLARDVAAAGTRVDLSYGGAIYASVPAGALGLSVEPRHLTALVEHARRIKAALAGHPATRHPADDRLSGVYGVIFYDELPDDDEGHARQRNVTVFADGEVDRSPCGSGSAARMALLHEAGLRGTLVHESVVGSVFRARVARVTGEGIVPEIEGMAYRTGRHVFELDPADPIGTGFTLR